MKEYKTYSDQKLIHLLKNNDQVAFHVLYYRYVQHLESFLKYYFNSTIDTDEVIQEIFVRIWEGRARLEEKSNLSFDSYLIQSVKNYVFNVYRSRLQAENYIKSRQLIDFSSNSTEEYINKAELGRFLEIGISKLPDIQKEIFIMSRQKGLSNDEIAERMNISKRTVEHHIYKALKHLKTAIPQYNTEIQFVLFTFFLFF